MLKQSKQDAGVKIYYTLQPELEKKFNPEDYVVIDPKTKAYYVGNTSVEAMKKARKVHPKGRLFLAQVGRMAGLMK